MALKEMFQAMKKEGYVTAPLDRYLFEEANRPNDRAVNVNAPTFTPPTLCATNANPQTIAARNNVIIDFVFFIISSKP